MKILDCESIDSTYASMEEILCIERPRLEEMLGNLDLDEACRRAGGKTGAEVLLEAVVKHSRSSHPAFDRTCWFHFTRSHPRNSFSKGILPLGEALPYLWGFLLMLLPEDFPLEKWYGFARNPPSGPYRAGLNDPATSRPLRSPAARRRALVQAVRHPRFPRGAGDRGRDLLRLQGRARL